MDVKLRERDLGFLVDKNQDIRNIGFLQIKVGIFFFDTSSKTFEGLVELGIRWSAVYHVTLQPQK